MLTRASTTPRTVQPSAVPARIRSNRLIVHHGERTRVAQADRADRGIETPWVMGHPQNIFVPSWAGSGPLDRWWARALTQGSRAQSNTRPSVIVGQQRLQWPRSFAKRNSGSDARHHERRLMVIDTVREVFARPAEPLETPAPSASRPSPVSTETKVGTRVSYPQARRRP